MKSIRLASILAAAAAVLASVAGTARAADITWTTGPAFGGANGHQAILTNGTLVEALDIGPGGGTVVVDPTGLNITFQKVNPGYLNQSPYDAVASAGSTDAGWNTVIRTADYTFPDLASVVALTGLTPGADYQLQVFLGDTRACCSSREQRVGDGNGHWSSFVSQGALISLVGTFTADGATQTLSFDANPADSPLLNAYVLRQVSSVPEPANLMLMLAGLGALGLRLRKPR